jgi:enoyl reductase-like protein
MKILQILTQDKATADQNKAIRKAKSLARNQERLIDKLEDKRDELLMKKENLLQVNLATVEETWNDQFQNSIVELALIEKQIEFANATMQEFFLDVK